MVILEFIQRVEKLDVGGQELGLGSLDLDLHRHQVVIELGEGGGDGGGGRAGIGDGDDHGVGDLRDPVATLLVDHGRAGHFDHLFRMDRLHQSRIVGAVQIDQLAFPTVLQIDGLPAFICDLTGEAGLRCRIAKRGHHQQQRHQQGPNAFHMRLQNRNSIDFV